VGEWSQLCGKNKFQTGSAGVVDTTWRFSTLKKEREMKKVVLFVIAFAFLFLGLNASEAVARRAVVVVECYPKYCAPCYQQVRTYYQYWCHPRCHRHHRHHFRSYYQHPHRLY
jgi:hypothetical protein